MSLCNGLLDGKHLYQIEGRLSVNEKGEIEG